MIAELQQVDGDKLVVLQKDGEGNDYSPLYGVDDACGYVPYNTWSGEIYEFGELVDDEDTYDGGDIVPAFVLYPVN